MYYCSHQASPGWILQPKCPLKGPSYYRVSDSLPQTKLFAARNPELGLCSQGFQEWRCSCGSNFPLKPRSLPLHSLDTCAHHF